MKVSFFGLFWARGQHINTDFWKSKDIIWLQLMLGEQKMIYEMKTTPGISSVAYVSLKYFL